MAKGKQFSLVFEARTDSGDTFSNALFMVREPPEGSRSVCTIVAGRSGVEWTDFHLSVEERDKIVEALQSWTPEGN